MSIIYFLKDNNNKNEFLHLKLPSKTHNKITSQFSGFILFV